MRRLQDCRLTHDQDERNAVATRADGARDGWRRLQMRSLSEVSAAVNPVIADMVSLGYSRKEVFAARIGLEEAIVNAVKHGNREDPAKVVQIDYQVTTEQLVADVVDEGPGFCPELLPDPFLPDNLIRPCGRGVFLMRAYMTWVCFNTKGNGVTLCKRRWASESAEQPKA